MPNQETNMLLRNTLAEEGHPVEVPTGYVPKTNLAGVRVNAAEVHEAHRQQHLADMRTAAELMAFGPAEQPAPKPNAHPPVWPLVMVDMAGRDKLGRERYGTPLQPHNGRDALRDAYEEALDLAAYLRAAMYERDGK